MSEPEPKFRFSVRKKKALNRTEPNLPITTDNMSRTLFRATTTRGLNKSDIGSTKYLLSASQPSSTLLISMPRPAPITQDITTDWSRAIEAARSSRALFQRAHQIPCNDHAEGELASLFSSALQLPTESVPMDAPKKPLQNDPTATEASLQERRAQAVEAFWKGMDAEFRRTFEPDI
ncbi:hypothetical protein C8J57DRAFT_1246334 [Mycena rebaudengoi]|nr:hypothetical protein C8J57DRAFT_1246334 [Mycena rebaudengoi]